MHKINHYQTLAEKRKRRVRSKISGTAERPRLTVHRSNKHIYAQVIDDTVGKTLASMSDKSLAKAAGKPLKGTKIEKAEAVAKELFKQLKSNKIKKVAFDRGSFKYHGRVKTIAETLRAAGVEV